MKIVISDAGKDWRGTESVTRTLATGLRDRGHEIAIFCVPDSMLHHRMTGAGFTCEPILGGPDLNPRVLLQCGRALARHKPDVVLTQKDKDLRWTGLSARLGGIPVVVRHVTDRPLKRNLRYRFFFGWVAGTHVANSASTRNTILESAPWLPNADIPIIHNGVDVDAIFSAPPANLGLPPGAVAVAFAGHFEARKGLIDFAQAWQRVSAEVPEAHAVIVGRGAREDAFRSALEGAPRVHWMGFRNDIASVFKSVDVFVMPSRFEGFGLVLAEAMAAGTACVAYNASNLPELLTHGRDGMLVEPGDIESLAATIIRLVRSPEERERLAMNAHATALRRFSCERMVAEYEQLLARAAGR